MGTGGDVWSRDACEPGGKSNNKEQTARSAPGTRGRSSDGISEPRSDKPVQVIERAGSACKVRARLDGHGHKIICATMRETDDGWIVHELSAGF